jgi:hypothetical protein
MARHGETRKKAMCTLQAEEGKTRHQRVEEGRRADQKASVGSSHIEGGVEYGTSFSISKKSKKP